MPQRRTKSGKEASEPRDTPASWDTARKRAADLITLPSFVSSFIQKLQRESNANNGLSPVSFQFLRQLAGTENIRRSLYLAAQTYRSAQVPADVPFYSQGLLKVFQPDELATIFSVLLLARKLSKTLPPKDQKAFLYSLMAEADAGGMIGDAISGIGLSLGILTGAFHSIGEFLMASLDADGWDQYQKHLAGTALPWDYEVEVGLWGCSHLQLAAAALQIVGITSERCLALYSGLANPEGASSTETGSQAIQTLTRVQVAWAWIDDMLRHARKPNTTGLITEFVPKAFKLEELFRTVLAIQTEGSSFCWPFPFLGPHKDASSIPQIADEAADRWVAPPSQSPDFSSSESDKDLDI